MPAETLVAARATLWSALAFVALVSAVPAAETAAENVDRPNVIVFFCDDLGYADPSCFGNAKTPTPNIDRLAAEGTRFTDFYVPQAVCSASRTGLLTGCYPHRVGILGALGPKSRQGIHKQEKLLSEICRERGYATAIYGKWHLGHLPPFLPSRHGFDRYYGLPYSNDMWPAHPSNKEFPALPMFRDDEIVDADVTAEDQTRLTTDYTERAVAFVEENRSRPFFLYLAHSMPHVPLFVSEKFRGKSEQGLYGDVLSEIDWSLGRLLETLDRLKLAEKTWIVFASDNGPWQSYGNHAGSAGPLREGKGTSFEGGVRIPCVMRWPGKIPAGVVNSQPAMTIDLVPTIAGRVRGELGALPIDGRDLWPIWSGRADATHPQEAYCFYWENELQAIRSGDWKLHFPHDYRRFVAPGGSDGRPGPYEKGRIELTLYNLRDDVGETTDVAEQNPEVVARLQKLADAARETLGDSARGVKGSGVRPAGQAE